MKKLLTILGMLVGIILFTCSASADLKQDAIQSNDPNALVTYLNSTKAGKALKISKANYTSNNYLVLSFDKKPKIKSDKQRSDFAQNLQGVMNKVPKQFVKKGIAFFNGDKDGANIILAFSAKEVSKHNYYAQVKKDTLKDFSANTTAFYIEPSFSDDTDGEITSGPETQGPKYGQDKETLIELIQDVTE